VKGAGDAPRAPARPPAPEIPVPLFALLAALCFEAADAAIGLATAGPDRTAQSAVASLAAGRLTLAALAAFGVWRRAPWGYWLGGTLALLVLTLETAGVLVPALARVEILDQVVESPGFFSVALTLGKALAYGWFLFALAVGRRRLPT